MSLKSTGCTILRMAWRSRVAGFFSEGWIFMDKLARTGSMIFVLKNSIPAKRETCRPTELIFRRVTDPILAQTSLRNDGCGVLSKTRGSPKKRLSPVTCIGKDRLFMRHFILRLIRSRVGFVVRTGDTGTAGIDGTAKKCRFCIIHTRFLPIDSMGK